MSGAATMLDSAWLAVLTRSRHEKQVHDQLSQKGVLSFLPTVPRISKWKDRKKQIDWPLFPGYCFARVDTQRLLPVLSCAGVLQIVSFGARPAEIPEFEIDAIRQLLATNLQFDPCPFLHEGMMVVVTNGPLKGARGRLVQKGPDFSLLLAIEMLGRALSVRVDYTDVEKL